MSPPESDELANEPTAEQSFEIAPAPRAVPSALRQRLRFGGMLNLTGWGLVVFGLLFVRIFAFNSELLNYVTFSGDKDLVAGHATFVYGTNASANGEPIDKVRYRYTVDGTEYQGYSFGSSTGFSYGQEVSVEYLSDSPSVSRIEGMRRYKFPSFAGVIVLLPLIGLGMAVFGLRRAQSLLRILENGLPARGKLVQKRATSVSINEQRVYRFVFAFQDSDGKTHKATIKAAKTGPIEDEATERLLYDPARPSSIVLVDTLPEGVSIDSRGRLLAPRNGVYYGLIPVVVAIFGVVLLAVV